MSSPRKTGARHIDNAALQVWIFLLKEGGYWNARELGRELAAAPMRATIRGQLDRLVLNGLARSRHPEGHHPSFGVTRTCDAPPGYEWMLEAALSATGVIDWRALEAEHERSDGPALGRANLDSDPKNPREATSVGAP